MSSVRGAKQFAKVGLPIVLFCCGGMVMLKQFIDGKLELQGQRTKSQSEREVELENEYKNMIAEFKDFDYELKPIPKPGDKK